MGLLDGKYGIIYGVRNERSICWGCAQSMAREGARLVLTFLGEREQRDVQKLVPSLHNSETVLVEPCDLTMPDQIEALHEKVGREFGRLDFILHGAAFAHKSDLAGRFMNTSSEGFNDALSISAYTFTAVSRAAEPLMQAGGSILTLTYLGAERVIPAYNIMGVAKAALESSVRYLAADLGPQNIRVNAISAGPTMTLSARGISGFVDHYARARENAPLRRNTTIDEVGDVAAFMASDLSRGITGDIIFVDNGVHILGA